MLKPKKNRPTGLPNNLPPQPVRLKQQMFLTGLPSNLPQPLLLMKQKFPIGLPSNLPQPVLLKRQMFPIGLPKQRHRQQRQPKLQMLQTGLRN